MSDFSSTKRKGATKAALHFLASRDHTEYEVREYLRKKGFSSDAVDEAIEDTTRWGYLDDERVSLRWAESRMEQYLWGPARIRWAFRHRGVDSVLAERIVEDLMQCRSEESLARRAVKKYLASHPGVEGAVGRRRLAGFLGRRGYSREAIHSVLKGHFDPNARDQYDDGTRD